MHGNDPGLNLTSQFGCNSQLNSLNNNLRLRGRNGPTNHFYEIEFSNAKSSHINIQNPKELGEYNNNNNNQIPQQQHTQQQHQPFHHPLQTQHQQQHIEMKIKRQVKSPFNSTSSNCKSILNRHLKLNKNLLNNGTPSILSSSSSTSCSSLSSLLSSTCSNSSCSAENHMTVHDDGNAILKSNNPCTPSIPTKEEKTQFRRSLDSATNLLFHRRTGLPLNSSPAPMRKSGTCFDFDSSLTSVNAIKKALFEKEPDTEAEQQNFNSLILSTSAPATNSCLLGNFEESVLNGRIEPSSTVHGFWVEIGASGSFLPNHLSLPVTVFFYNLQSTEKSSSPYLGHISLGKKGYHVPRKGTVQVTLFNPHRTIVKMFVVAHDLSDMPPNSQTFLRQRTFFMPVGASENDSNSRKWLRYLIHLRFKSSKSGRIKLHTDIRIIVFRKHDLDVAMNERGPYELRSFIQYPVNPKYSIQAHQ